jgi:hypothetical protein
VRIEARGVSMNSDVNPISVNSIAIQVSNLRQIQKPAMDSMDQFNTLKPDPITTNELPNLKGKVTFPFESLESPKSEKIKVGFLISEFWSPKMTIEKIKIEFNRVHEALANNKNDIKLITETIQATLRAAAVSDKKIEASLINYVIDCKEVVMRQNYFNGIGHYFDYMITRYQGIDCRKLIIVKEALHQLKRCVELEPQFLEAQIHFEQLLQEIQAAWKE